MMKRLFDLVISSILLLILSPVILLTSIIVILDTGFPVFYRGKRVGKGGEIFNILKFRSMVVDSRQKGPGITARSDCRVTRSGRFLRKWKLDEFPQFFNVLFGDMSLVGPRPEDPQYVKHYSEEEKSALTVKPGITGVSQILFRNEEQLLAVDSPEEYYVNCIIHQKLRYDLAYINSNPNIFTDFIIILLTILVILLPKRGYVVCRNVINRIIGLDGCDTSCGYRNQCS
jgi:lipopolysaccharide/colanic/teichoic acid biosynthesis glycosyltransferase